ncbi:MAG: hypothetical protein IIC87_07140, partial [Chloroflexi bacterium]|nr:hypothetical protein [Chloroflexota bacterium]
MRVSSKEYYGLAALSELVQAGKQRPLAVAEIALKELAKAIPGGRENMIAAGLAAGFIGL